MLSNSLVRIRFKKHLASSRIVQLARCELEQLVDDNHYGYRHLMGALKRKPDAFARRAQNELAVEILAIEELRLPKLHRSKVLWLPTRAMFDIMKSNTHQ